MSTAVFGYGSLVDRHSAALTLGRPVEQVRPARLAGWRRRFSTARDNLHSEKTFARVSDGWVPAFVLALNLEGDPDSRDEPPNGALIEVDETDLDRLDRRELRYDRIDVTDDLRSESVVAINGSGRITQVFAYVARAEHRAALPPKDAVILTTYSATVEAAFATIGRAALQTYDRTTGPLPAPLMDGRLVGGVIREGNPRSW